MILRPPLAELMAVFNFARRLKTPGITPRADIRMVRISEPDRFILNRSKLPELNI